MTEAVTHHQSQWAHGLSRQDCALPRGLLQSGIRATEVVIAAVGVAIKAQENIAGRFTLWRSLGVIEL